MLIDDLLFLIYLSYSGCTFACQYLVWRTACLSLTYGRPLQLPISQLAGVRNLQSQLNNEGLFAP
jgi:hypothetical protein